MYVYSMPDTTTDTIASGSDAQIWTRFSSHRSWQDKRVWPLGTWTSSAGDLTLDISDGIPLQTEGSDQGKWSGTSRWATYDYYLQIAGAVQSCGISNFYTS